VLARRRHGDGQDREDRNVVEGVADQACELTSACVANHSFLAGAGGRLLRRQLDGELRDVEPSKAIVSGGADGRLLVGDSASDELLGAAEIRTPAFRRSTRARELVPDVAATSAPAGVGSGACFHAKGVAGRRGEEMPL
jgi:hypothetical protein